MREVGDDLDALFEHLRKREALHPERLVSFEPKGPVEVAVSPDPDGKTATKTRFVTSNAATSKSSDSVVRSRIACIRSSNRAKLKCSSPSGTPRLFSARASSNATRTSAGLVESTNRPSIPPRRASRPPSRRLPITPPPPPTPSQNTKPHPSPPPPPT